MRLRSMAGAALVLATTLVPAAPAAAAEPLTYTEYTNDGASNAHATRCIGIANGWAGLWDCTGRGDQWWAQTGTVRVVGDLYYGQVKNQNGQFLGVDAGKTDSKARIRGWTCLPNADDQYWAQIGGPHLIRFVNYKSGLVIGTLGGSVANGAELIQYASLTYDDHADQFWTIAAQRDAP